ncbi:MAG: hypothetical protein N3E44_06205 [Candidatus Bathyarchaeota archaeon]|nr:hypothetical protein [Candidatus Bathyarchaeota archaeon]
MDCIEESVEVYGRRYTMIHLKLENFIVVVFSEGDPKLGTIAIATDIGLSSVILGGRSVMLAKSMASHLAYKFKIPVLLSVNISGDVSDLQVFDAFLKLLDRVSMR